MSERAESESQTDESEDKTARYARGALVQENGSGRYHHITARFRCLDTDRVLYKVLDPTHTHDWWYYEDDLLADFRPAGIQLGIGVKPAEVFGSRVNGILRGHNELKPA
jgi:hypothetical protein